MQANQLDEGGVFTFFHGVRAIFGVVLRGCHYSIPWPVRIAYRSATQRWLYLSPILELNFRVAFAGKIKIKLKKIKKNKNLLVFFFVE
jgi:hypothetical protein